MDDQPRKVDPAAVEVIGTHGEVVKEAKSSKQEPKFQQTPFGNVRVIQGGPWLLLLLPIALPIIIIALFFISILALFFGKSVFKIASRGIRRP
jgi:hypothetical protein